MSWIEAAWHFLIGWAGIDMLIGFAAVAVAVLEPPWLDRFIPNLRTVAIYTAAVAFTCMGLIAHGYKNGITETKRQWDAALAREAADGAEARDQAVATVGPLPSDRSMFRSDPDNRDRGKGAGEHSGPVRWLDPYHLFRR